MLLLLLQNIYLEKGIHKIEVKTDESGTKHTSVQVTSSLSIIGASRTECIVIGGFIVSGKKVDHVIIKLILSIYNFTTYNCSMRSSIFDF